ncbi:MAG: WD40 repeat domain-containing protein, partial [Planctomycetota bacterium]
AEPHSLAITADGRTAAVGLDNGSIAAVDLVQRKQVRTIASATRPISDLRFAPGGRYLAVGSWDWTLRLADINGPAIEGWIAPTEWHVSCVAWSPDGQLMLAGTMKGQLFCFHRTTGLLTSVDLGSPIMDMKFTRNLGLAVLCDDGVHQINYTPLLSGSEVNDVDVQIVIQFERATAFDFSPDEQLMVVAVGAQGKLIVVDLTSDRDRFAAVIESAHQHSVCSIAFSPAGTRFASTGRDGWVHFWNIQPARDTWLQPAAATPHTEAALDPDGKRLVYIGQDGRMRVVDVDKPDEARWIPAHEHEQGLLVHWLTDGRLLTVGHDGAAMIWSRDLRQKELTFRVPLGAGDNQNVISARVIRENPLRIAIVRLADVTMTNERAERLWVAPRPDGHTDTSFLDAIPSADRRKVFVSMTDGSVLQFDAQSGALQSLRQLASIGIFEGFAASPDGRYLLTGAHVGEVACWPLSDAGIGEPQIRRVSSHPDNVNRVLFTPDGRLAITADSTRVAFHDASTWELLRAIDQGMSRLTISGDGLLLIVQSHVDYRVRLLGMWAPDDVDLAERITGRQRVEFTLQCVTAERQAELRSRWPTLPTRFNPPDPPAAAFWYLAWAAARNGIASDDGVAMRKWLAANPTHRLADRARTLLQALADGATAEAAVDLLLAD